jgi:hypothetical protein
MPPAPLNENGVFLNIPYDEEFQPLYLAYIVGLYQLGLEPYIASAIPGGRRRLSRILDLIQSCRYSIHDLCRVELDSAGSGTPRFNMPLELGMTITWADLHEELHTWFVFESKPRRLDFSTSDLGGTDANIHLGTVEGILCELRNAFVSNHAPSVATMLADYFLVQKSVEKVLEKAGTRNLYAASVFRELCFLAWKAASRRRGSTK